MAYVQPNVWVKETASGWKVTGNGAAWPKIRFNRKYCDPFQEAGSGDATWKNKLNEARQKIDILELRKDTVIRLAEYIVAEQEDFFTFGEIGSASMLLKNTTTELDVAESTISHAANRRYLACPWGIFTLRYFFTQTAGTDSDSEGVNQGTIKTIISQLIDNENSSRPYFGETLVRLLKQQGTDIIRRTITKYRESLNILPTHKRRTVG